MTKQELIKNCITNFIIILFFVWLAVYVSPVKTPLDHMIYVGSLGTIIIGVMCTFSNVSTYFFNKIIEREYRKPYTPSENENEHSN